MLKRNIWMNNNNFFPAFYLSIFFFLLSRSNKDGKYAHREFMSIASTSLLVFFIFFFVYVPFLLDFFILVETKMGRDISESIYIWGKELAAKESIMDEAKKRHHLFFFCQNLWCQTISSAFFQKWHLNPPKNMEYKKIP